MTGVLTGADTAYFYSLQRLVVFCPYPVAVVDDGLQQTERQWLLERGVQLLEPIAPDLPRHKSKSSVPWNSFLKPWKCLQSPWEVSYWIDADAIVIHELPELSLPFFTAESYNPEAAARSKLLRGKLTKPPVNAGVFGWQMSNSQFIKDWCELTEQVFEDGLASECICRDQDVLNLLLQNLSFPILSDARLNFPAIRKPYRNFHELKSAHPDAYVIHWNHFPKVQMIL